MFRNFTSKYSICEKVGVPKTGDHCRISEFVRYKDIHTYVTETYQTYQ